jgi:hypothetical protein
VGTVITFAVCVPMFVTLAQKNVAATIWSIARNVLLRAEPAHKPASKWQWQFENPDRRVKANL